MGGECGTHRKEMHADILVRKLERSRHLARRGSKTEDKWKNLK